jgi:hypothetical protein
MGGHLVGLGLAAPRLVVDHSQAAVRLALEPVDPAGDRRAADVDPQRNLGRDLLRPLASA